MNLIDAILAAAILAAPVLVLTSLGGLIHHRTGVVNIALEGQILVGAFVGMMLADRFGSLMVGFLGAAIVGAFAGYVTTLIITRLSGNEIIVGLGANTFILGLVGFILSAWFASSGTYRPKDLPDAPEWGLGFLEGVPIVGPILGRHDPVIWLTPVVAVVIAWLLTNSRIGLRARSIGEDPRTAINLGIPTDAYKEVAGALAGLLAAVGGAHLATIFSGLFNVDMSAGRGFIALAAVYFGRGRVGMTVFPALLFVFADAAQRRLQTTGFDLPTQLIQTLPYLIVIIALVVPALRRRPRLSPEPS